MFGTVKLARNAIKHIFSYNVEGIAFDREGECSFGNEYARNVVFFVSAIVHLILTIKKVF